MEREIIEKSEKIPLGRKPTGQQGDIRPRAAEIRKIRE